MNQHLVDFYNVQINKLISKCRKQLRNHFSFTSCWLPCFLWWWLFAFVVVVGSWIYTIQLIWWTWSYFSRNFVLNWKTHLAFLSQLSWNSNNGVALPSYIIIFGIKFLQNNRNLFYIFELMLHPSQTFILSPKFVSVNNSENYFHVCLLLDAASSIPSLQSQLELH